MNVRFKGLRVSALNPETWGREVFTIASERLNQKLPVLRHAVILPMKWLWPLYHQEKISPRGAHYLRSPTTTPNPLFKFAEIE